MAFGTHPMNCPLEQTNKESTEAIMSSFLVKDLRLLLRIEDGDDVHVSCFNLN